MCPFPSDRTILPDERGQALVEFALVLPLLLLLIAGGVELTEAWRIRTTLAHVAREGVRVAVLPTATEGEVQAVVRRQMTAAGLTYRADLVALSCENAAGLCTDPGTFDVVRIDYPYHFRLLGPAVRLVCAGADCGAAPPGRIVLSSVAVGRNE